MRSRLLTEVLVNEGCALRQPFWSSRESSKHRLRKIENALPATASAVNDELIVGKGVNRAGKGSA